MKGITILIFISIIYAQVDENRKFDIILQNNLGYTLVDVAQAMEISDLEDWEQFNYKGLIQLLIPKNNFSWGGELGFNRLYSWEERYKTSNGYDRWRWGTIWTWHIGILIKLDITEQYYLTSGVGVYTFMNDTGTTIGFPFAIGHDIKVNDRLTLPVEFRTDIIFGSATPIALGVGIGIKLTI